MTVFLSFSKNSNIEKVRKEKTSWSEFRIKSAVKEYLQFLFLIKKHLGDKKHPIVPTKDADQIWHHHILDTRKYQKDCKNFFGRMIHHYPYLE